MAVLIVLGILSLTARIHGYFFEDGHDHIYKYQSISDMMGLHNVTTIMQVGYRQNRSFYLLIHIE